MATKILLQHIDYDKSTGAWGRYQQSCHTLLHVDLVQYHDSQNDALLAALPQILRDWAVNSPGDPGRLIRAGCIATDRQAIRPSVYPGQLTVHSQNGNGSYTVYTTDSRCTCLDWRPERQCKHVLAIAARDVLDSVTISCTVDHAVSGGRTRNIMIHDSKLILVQEGRGEPRKPRNPQWHTARRWLQEHNYELQQMHWIDDVGAAHRRRRYHYVPMKEAVQ